MTKGISPKVKVPAVAKIVIGIILLAAWVITDGNDTTNPLFVTGCSLVGAATLITLPFGYQATPGEIAVDVGRASDRLLDRTAIEHAQRATPPSADS